MNNLVSVVIPTFKRPFAILEKAINSVLNQSYENLELIVVDDSPNKDLNRLEVQRKIKNILDSRIRYIQHEESGGACKARNTGINNSNGGYIAFLDDDDEWLRDKLKIQIDKFDEPDVGLVSCASYTIHYKNGNEVEQKIREREISECRYEDLILHNHIGSTSFVVLKKEVLEHVGLFNESLKSAQDYELWLRVSKSYKIRSVNIPLVNYYVHDEERISTNIENRILGLEKLNELNIEYLRKHPKVYSIRKLKLVPYYKNKYGYRKSLSKWYEAVKIYPFHVEPLKHLIKIVFYTS